MNSRKWLGNAMSPELPEASKYRAFLRELQIRTSDLWDSMLCLGPNLNANELMKEHLALREYLVEIETMQKSFARTADINLTHSEQRKAALSDFVVWATTVGINHQSVEIAYSEDMDGFGLTSANYTSIGSDLLQVPRKAILSWDHARKSSFLKRAFDCDIIIRSMDNVALALMLCCQKLMDDSSWQPYIKVLPETFNTPLFFTVEQLQKSRGETQKEEPIYVNSPFTAANFTFNLYRWSVACISTRVNMIPSEMMKDEGGQPVMIPSLIPFLDMANHKYTDDAFLEAVHFSDETDCAEIIAIRDYKPFEPVNIFYGWRSNRDFLLHNGFVPVEKNIRDVYKLKIGLPKTKREEARLDLIRALGFTIESNIFAFEVKILEPYFHESLVQFAQIYVLDEIAPNMQLEEIVNSPKNIRKAWSFLRDRFALLRRAYGEVVDPLYLVDNFMESAEFYRSSDTIRKSMIARLKLSEMEILQKALDFSSKQLDSL